MATALTMPQSWRGAHPLGAAGQRSGTRALEPGGRKSTFTDVTDYLVTLEALRQSEARWRSPTIWSSD